MNYLSYAPQGPWQDINSYDTSDTTSVDHTSIRRPSTTPADIPQNFPISLQLTKKRSRRAHITGPLHERARDRIKELEQRIRELESSASETTARATIKVLQTRVRDLEAEVDCLTMRLENAEKAMTRTRVESAKPSTTQNVLPPVPPGTMAMAYGDAPNFYISAGTNQPVFTLSPSSDQAMPATAVVDSTIPRSANAALRPLINWDVSPVNASRRSSSVNVQRPVFPAQHGGMWPGAY